MRADRGDGSDERPLARLVEVGLLVVDDLGLMPLRGDEPADLYEAVRLRDERRSIVFTSNRSAAGCPAVFGDLPLASAAVDRLRHPKHLIENDGPSYRDPRTHVGPRA